MMRVYLDVRAVIEVPYGTNLSLLAMTLRDSKAVLHEHIGETYEVQVRADPADQWFKYGAQLNPAADQSKDG